MIPEEMIVNQIYFISRQKVKEVTFADDHESLEFKYDSYGRRVMKYDSRSQIATFYTYDASGNVMGIYERKFDGTYDALYISQLPIYGSSRLGVINSNTKLSYLVGNNVNICENLYHNDANSINIKFVYCNRQYELTNHLGNVMTTISDNRIRVPHQNDSTLTLCYLPKILTTNDYYPFGMQMRERSYDHTGTGYRFGFNQKELDPEGMGGGGSTYDYGFRIYNPQIARFLSVDPLTSDYPWYSTYQFAGNMPIWAIDLDGLEEEYYSKRLQDSHAGSLIIKISNQTTSVKEFHKKLKSQNKVDVFYYLFNSKNTVISGVALGINNYQEFTKHKYPIYLVFVKK
jgi:RHS repeat-associated protein